LTLSRCLEGRSKTADSDGRSQVRLLEQAYLPSEALGCHAHPSVSAHMRFARELTALLERELGW
jgi:hypothetical protein